ncbi:unnamed protein product, partial [Mesorhabditis belari]|uniref:Enamine deaminase RidA n=1 Tax=Mesorhabditis belari TaxID=2138241 RepID=A0AAF3J1G4_9BILA
MKRVINSSKVPSISAPLSQAIQAGDFIFVSGQVGRESNGDLGKTVERQVELALRHIESILHEVGATMENVVKVSVWLADIKSAPSMNLIYKKFFSNNPPARAAYQVAKLPMDACVEIEAIAHLPKKSKL